MSKASLKTAKQLISKCSAEEKWEILLYLAEDVGVQIYDSLDEFEMFEKYGLVLPRTRRAKGGNKRTNPVWQDDEVLIKYAEEVEIMKLLARNIKRIYKDCAGGDNWIDELRQNSNFIKLSNNVSENVINLAIWIVASDEDSDTHRREPVSIACRMAREKLDLPYQSAETLRSYYLKGKRLIKENRGKTRK